MKGAPGLTGRTQRAHPSHIFLNRMLRFPNSQFQHLTLDPFGTPSVIVAGHLLNRRDGFRCKLNTFRIRPRLLPPKQTEPFTMPAE